MPRPRVAWFRDNQLLRPESSDDPDDTNGPQQQEVTAIDGFAAAIVTSTSSTSTGGDSSEEVIEVDLTLTGLTRSDLHTELTCQAWNYFYNDEDYSIIVTNSGSSNIDTHTEGYNMNGDVDPIHWTSRQRQSSLTAVVHVDMNCKCNTKKYFNSFNINTFIFVRLYYSLPWLPISAVLISPRLYILFYK